MEDEKKTDNADLMAIATAARPIDGQQVYNIVDSAFNRKLAPRMQAVEDKLNALITQVRKLHESLDKKAK